MSDRLALTEAERGAMQWALQCAISSSMRYPANRPRTQFYAERMQALISAAKKLGLEAGERHA